MFEKKLRTIICEREDVARLTQTDRQRDNICKPRLLLLLLDKHGQDGLTRCSYQLTDNDPQLRPRHR